jgi:AhpC/TSA family
MLALQCVAFASAVPYGLDLNGHPVDLSHSNAPAIVLFFTASDCPIASRYEPEMLRLEHEFAPSGVEFWWVYPNPADTAEQIRNHQLQFVGSTHVIRDTKQSLIQIAHATVTPEAAILVPSSGTLREVYHGRIDDRYIAFGRERPRALRHELEDAIAALLANRSVPEPAGPPVGCSIVPLQLRSRS